MRIMFVGDSMTIGSAGEHTWRYRMWQHLERSPGPFEIVGPHCELYAPHADAAVSHAYADPGFPEHARRHLAGWGHGWVHMAPLIGEAVAEHRAQVLLVSLGLIDLGYYTNAEQTAANVHRFITGARETEPGVRIAVMPVIPNIRAYSDEPFGVACERFNELLAKTLADLDTQVSPLLPVPPPKDWDLSRDTHDGTHPSASGEHKLAAAFADAMYQAWGLAGPYESAG